LTCETPIQGRRKKYCQPACRPSFYVHKTKHLSECQVCGKPLELGRAGRPRKNCSNKCRVKNAASKHYNKLQTFSCAHCSKPFESKYKRAKFCQDSCRLDYYQRPEILKQIYEREKRKKYPDGTRTHTCGWCGQPRTFRVGQSVVNAFHDDCREEANRAKNRTKSVKRIKGIQTVKLSADQIVATYGSTCYLCEKEIDVTLVRTSRYGLTVDHVVPLSKGGQDTLENLRPTHWICNIQKSDKSLEEYRAESR
jgi:5-methylcytosine-specific restriction endonuclease McrA